MKLIEKAKIWWKTKTMTEKIYILLGGLAGLATAASVVSAACAVQTRHCLDDVKINVNLFPEGPTDPNPITLERVPADEIDFSKPVPSPADDGRYDPYELARDSFNALEKYCDDGDVEDLERCQEKLLQLSWDLAAREGVIEKAEDEIPYQLHD